MTEPLSAENIISGLTGGDDEFPDRSNEGLEDEATESLDVQEGEVERDETPEEEEGEDTKVSIEPWEERMNLREQEMAENLRKIGASQDGFNYQLRKLTQQMTPPPPVVEPESPPNQDEDPLAYAAYQDRQESTKFREESRQERVAQDVRNRTDAVLSGLSVAETQFSQQNEDFYDTISASVNSLVGGYVSLGHSEEQARQIVEAQKTQMVIGLLNQGMNPNQIVESLYLKAQEIAEAHGLYEEEEEEGEEKEEEDSPKPTISSSTERAPASIFDSSVDRSPPRRGASIISSDDFWDEEIVPKDKRISILQAYPDFRDGLMRDGQAAIPEGVTF